MDHKHHTKTIANPSSLHKLLSTTLEQNNLNLDYLLSTGQHISDASSVSATGLFDPFTMHWAGWAQSLFNIPASMFPKIVDSAGDFGRVPASIFGAEISIGCSMADQSASLFGSGCFESGDLKLTMGTGSFLNVNTGSEAHASVTGNFTGI